LAPRAASGFPPVERAQEDCGFDPVVAPVRRHVLHDADAHLLIAMHPDQKA